MNLLDITTANSLKIVNNLKKECNYWERKYEKLAETLDTCLDQKGLVGSFVLRYVNMKLKRRNEKIVRQSSV